MASLSCPHALKRNSNTAQTRCGPPHLSDRSGASAPRCLLSGGERQEVGRAVLLHQGAVCCDLGCSAECNTWLKDSGTPCMKGGACLAEGAALEPGLGVGALWRCCGGSRGGPGAEILLLVSGKGMQASCDNPLVNVEGRTWSLTPQRPEERCQAWAGCRFHKRGLREPEHHGSD